jgi:hypothetical protein
VQVLEGASGVDQDRVGTYLLLSFTLQKNNVQYLQFSCESYGTYVNSGLLSRVLILIKNPKTPPNKGRGGGGVQCPVDPKCTYTIYCTEGV